MSVSMGFSLIDFSSINLYLASKYSTAIQQCFKKSSLGRFDIFKSTRDPIPIYDWPPRAQIIPAPILIFQVVGVFSNVVDQERIETLHHRIVVSAGGHDFQSDLAFFFAH